MRHSIEMVQKRSLIDPNVLQSQDLGEITPAFFRSGPSQARSCTDVLCLLIFWLNAIIFTLVMVLGFINGDPKLLYEGYDIANNACGEGNYSNYPYLYFYKTSQPQNLSNWYTVCVSSCPKTGDTTLSCGVNSVVTNCNDNKTVNIYDTTPYMGFLCIPTNQTIYSNLSSALSDITGATEILMEIYNDWKVESVSLGFAYFMGIFSIFMTFCAPHAVILFFLIFVFVGLLAFGSLFIVSYADPNLLTSVLEGTAASSITSSLSSISDNFKLIPGIVFLVLAILMLIYVAFRHTKIRLLMNILKSTALFLRARKSFTFISFIFFFAVVGYILLWVLALLYLYTWKENETTNYENEVYRTPFFHFETSTVAIIGIIVHLVALVINLGFLLCSYVFLLSASCVFWYFSHADWEEHDMKLPHPLRQALRLYFRYHFGSIAIGSFLMMLFRLFNSTFGIFYNKITSYGRETPNKCTQYSIKTCVCFFYCYEKVFRYITRDSFISIALTGKNFLSASRDAFYLTKRNAEKYERVDGLGNLVFWLGKLFICLSSSFVTLFLALFVSFFSEGVDDPLIPILVVFVTSYLLGNIVMNLIATTTDSLIYLYLIDEEIEKTYFNFKKPHSAPLQLREFMKETLKDIETSD